MNDIITVSGVSGYIDQNNTAWLRLDDVARGLGFTETKDGKEYVMWRRVASYLRAFGTTAESGELPDYIPENIFYRLGFKAGNKTAEVFQAKVADEILPTIRKTGSYSAKQMTPIQMLAAQAQAMADLERKTNAALESSQAVQKRFDGAVEALAAPTPVNWQTATKDKISHICKVNGLSYLKEYDALYRELEHNAHVDLKSRVGRLKGRMKKAGYTCAECDRVTQLHVISRDPALKLAFDGIVRRFAAKYAGVSADG